MAAVATHVTDGEQAAMILGLFIVAVYTVLWSALRLGSDADDRAGRL